jgi:hypothetical protein
MMIIGTLCGLLVLTAAQLGGPILAGPGAGPDTTVRFAVIGDYGSGNSEAQDVAALIARWNVDFVLTVGDNNYPSGEASTIDQNVGQFYSSYMYPYSGSYGQGNSPNRFFPTLGNHDWQVAGAEPYLDYFTLPGNERYYDTAWGPVHLFALDSDNNEPDGNSATSAQATWLQTRLAAAPEPWKLVYMHHAPYSSGASHGSNPRLQWPFQQWGATAVLAGHEHNYERIVLDGFPYFVNGLGGRSLYGFGSPVAGSQVRYNDDYGAMLVQADPTTLTFQFVSRANYIIDTYTVHAGGQSTPVAGTPVPPAPSPTPAPPRPTPIRAAFYYPWFPETWGHGTNYHPTLGAYHSADPAVIASHIAAMRHGRISAGIASWWGQGTTTDSRIPALLAGANGSDFQWAVYYEQEGTTDPSVAQIQSDLIYLRDHYATHPRYLRIDGRFVVFVYGGESCAGVDRWHQANTVGAYIVLKVFSGYRTCAHQPASWHQYAPAGDADHQAGYSYSISPGFWQAGQPVRLARDLARWRQNIQDMVASGEPFQLITTFNEWGEGTATEAAQEWASSSGYGAYLDALHDACATSFSDVDGGNPFFLPIQCLACRGLVSGYADGTYRWGNSVTRGQLAKILANAAGFNDAIPTGQQTFADVAPSHPFWLWVERLTAHDAISGYTCGGPGEPCDSQQRPYFRPGADATRAQIARITAAAAQLADPVPPTQQTFEDVPAGDPFRQPIEQLAARGILTGYACGGPGEPCVPPGNRPYFRRGVATTRGQMSKIAANTFFPNCQAAPRN